MEKNPLSKEELITQLKDLRKKKVPQNREGHMKIMCYCRSIALPKEIIIKCDHCDKEYLIWDTNYRHQKFCVSEIQALGYDADLEILCTNCLYKRLVEENSIKAYDDLLLKENDSNIRLFYLFKFKARGQEKWHVAIVEDVNDYRAIER